MTLAADTPMTSRSRGLLLDLGHALRTHLPRSRRPPREAVPSTQDALLRALCHHMRSPRAAIEAALGNLARVPEARAELVQLAQANTAHLSSMLRTADATAGGMTRPGPGPRLLRDVL